MKKIISVLCVLAIVFSFSGCSLFQKKPEKTVEAYCEALKNFDKETMATYVVKTEDDKDKKEDSESDESEQELLNSISDWFVEKAKDITYSVESAEVKDDKATVSVKFTYTDASKLGEELLGEYMQKAFAYAFDDSISESELQEKMNKEFVDIFNSKKDTVETSTSEITVKFDCEKVDDEWKISKAPDEITNIMTCNVTRAFESLSTDDEDEKPEEDANYISTPVNTEVQLATCKFTVLKSEEKDTLKSESLGDSVKADEGTKFVVVTVKVENTQKKQMTADFYDIKLIDNQDREFGMYDDATWYVDDTINYKEINPSMSVTGTMVYNVPKDASDLYLLIGKAETNDYYKFFVK